MADFEQEYGEQIIVPVRIAFASLDKPDTGHRFSTNKYGFTCIISKDDEDTIKTITNALCDVAQVASLDELTKHPFMDKNGRLRDGDDQAYKGKEGLAGSYFFKTTSKNPIRTLTAMIPDGDPIDCAASELYNGCYCAAILTPAMYDQGCVTLYPSALIMTGHGQRFSNVQSVDPVQAFRNWAKTPEPGTPTPLNKVPPELQAAPATPAVAPRAPMPSVEESEEKADPGPIQRRRGRPPMNQNAPSATAQPQVAPQPAAPAPKAPNGRGSLSDLMNK